eukprot:5487013-Pyramimonas_sp.AAC.1
MAQDIQACDSQLSGSKSSATFRATLPHPRTGCSVASRGPPRSPLWAPRGHPAVARRSSR